MIRPARRIDRHLSAHDLLRIHFSLNHTKLAILLLHHKHSPAKHERSWWRWVTDLWQEYSTGVQAGFAERHVLYHFKVPWSRDEYIGETTIGLHARERSHVSAAHQHRIMMDLHVFLGQKGSHRGVWLPLTSWPNMRSTKAQRLAEAGALIWERQPSLNRDGRRVDSTRPGPHRHTVLFAQRRNRRQHLCVRQRQGARTSILSGHRQREAGRLERRRRHALISLAVRLARRPWKKLENFAQIPAIQQVRALSTRQLLRLYHVGDSFLQGVQKSIFYSNMSLALSTNAKALLLSVTIRSFLLHLRAAGRSFLRSLRSWGSQLRVLGIIVILLVNLRPTTAKSIVQIADNTQAWAVRPAAELCCNCSTGPLPHGHLLAGHYLIPMLDWFKLMRPLPSGWTTRSRCSPDIVDEILSLQKCFKQLHGRFYEKLRRGVASISPTSTTYADLLHRARAQRCVVPAPHRSKALLRWQNKHPGVPTVGEVKAIARLAGPRVAPPVDRASSDGASICPLLTLSSSELSRLYKDFFRSHLDFVEPVPYSFFKRAAHHKSAPLRVWPKNKTMRLPDLATWSQLRWGPLVSYLRHHYRDLFSLAGKTCSAFIRRLNWGFGAEGVRTVLEDAFSFNGYQRPGSHQLAHRDLKISTFDVKDFFPSVTPQELLSSVAYALTHLLRDRENLRYL